MKHILTTLFIAFFIEVTYAQNGSEIFTSSGVFTVPDGITSITIEVVGAGGTGGGNGGGEDTTGIDENEWEFSTDSGYFHGAVDFAITADTLGFTYLNITGTNDGDSILTLATFFLGTEIVPGTYTTQSISSNAIFDFSDPFFSSIYYAYLDPLSTSLVTIIITSYDSTTREVKGTFSGLANDESGNAVINIKEGKFDAIVSP